MSGRGRAFRFASLIHWQRHQRRKAWSYVSLGVLGLCVAAWFGWSGGAGELSQDTWRRYHEQTFEVVRVVDGDTIDVDMPDGNRVTTRIRLWGVNTPELARPEVQRKAQPFAEEAKAWATEVAEGQNVTLLLAKHRLRDRHGRVLAYVILPDGSSLNERLLTEGLAVADSRWSHAELDAYEALEQQAREQGVGRWAER